MPRYRRGLRGWIRKNLKIYKLGIQKSTVYSALSVLTIALAVLIILSFSQKGELLIELNQIFSRFFGVGTIFIPFLLLSAGLMLSKLKTPISQPNVLVGGFLLLICFLGLTKGGVIGEEIFVEVAILITPLGAFLILSGGALIGLIVFFNTSFEQIIANVIKTFKVGKRYILASKFPALQEKLPFRLKQRPKLQPKSESEPKPVTKLAEELTTGVISNVPGIQSRVWEYPPLSLLSESFGGRADRGDVKNNAAIIEKTLDSFGISAQVVEVNLGPAVTQYALEVALGTKLSKITALSNDLALALAAPTGQIRIEAPIPGRSLVGVELPNRSLEFVTLKQILESEAIKKIKSKLAVSLGLDVSGKPKVADIARMPHVLIAGQTGSGKSVLLNSWIASLLFRATPNEVKLILVDPKRVELTQYNGIPHLLNPVIVEVEKVVSALKWAIAEMDRRYKLFAQVGARNINIYNELSGFQALPYIIIIVDELADVILFAQAEVEDCICRIAQMSRATGIHLIISTQRPSVDVLTGLIKANIPCRISFAVSSLVDSRVIIDMPGAEKLLGRGDMLYIPPEQAKPTRIQGAYVSELETQKLINFLKKRGIAPTYTEEITEIPVGKAKPGVLTSEEEKDELFQEAIRIICQYDRASASLLQRRLSIGYARAARILDQLQAVGAVGPADGAKPREVLVKNPESFWATFSRQ